MQLNSPVDRKRPTGLALVPLARDDVGVRIETHADTLTASLVDHESGSPVENIAVVEKVSSDAPALRSATDYSARLATYLGKKGRRRRRPEVSNRLRSAGGGYQS